MCALDCTDYDYSYTEIGEFDFYCQCEDGLTDFGTYCAMDYSCNPDTQYEEYFTDYAYDCYCTDNYN